MFESDDYDQILSQFDFPEIPTNSQNNKSAANLGLTANDSNIENNAKKPPRSELEKETNDCLISKAPQIINAINNREISPKHTKRKIIDSYFDHKSKRKFPGPAGLLNGSFKENNDESVCQMELFSQDVDFSQNCLSKDSFDCALWKRLHIDVKDWNLGPIDSIKTIKQQAILGNLRRRKADTVTAFIETVDRSITDPLITLRDSTGSIKCTLHRDAWTQFSSYIVSEYCALVLWKPTVLTTGSAFKKHYLNITLSNIYAVYSSAVLNEEINKELPDGYKIAYEEDFTVIKADKTLSASLNKENSGEQSFGNSKDIFDGLDTFFDDEEF